MTRGSVILSRTITPHLPAFLDLNGMLDLYCIVDSLRSETAKI